MTQNRIWGLLRPILVNMLPRQWHFVGCVGPEERSSAAAGVLRAVGASVVGSDCLQFIVPNDHHSGERQRRVADTRARLIGALPGHGRIVEMELFGTVEPLDDLVNTWIVNGKQHLLLDLSTMPKKVFFPLLRLILRSHAFLTVLAVYSKPQRYAEEPLAEEPDPPMPLPLFSTSMRAPTPTGGIIAIGLEVLGIVELLEAGGGAGSVHVLFPIPSNPNESNRTWTFMHRLHSAHPMKFTPPRHLSALDFGEAYSFIESLSDGFQGSWWLAPFGPKPISLAMAVVAIEHDWPVYYSQPTIYNPAYSIGVAEDGREAAVYGYLLVNQGR